MKHFIVLQGIIINYNIIRLILNILTTRKDKEVMSDKNKKSKVGVYCRVSTREQAELGFGIDVQMNKINAYLSLFDYEVDYIRYFVDEGISVKSMKRKRLQEMFDQVKKGELDLVIIYKLDRLSRSVIDVYSIIEMLNRYGCNLIAVMDKIDINSANGRMLVGMLAIISQWERETISERTNDGMDQMVKMGLYPLGGKAPFGYNRTEDNKLVVDKKEVEIIEKMFEMAIAGYHMSEIRRYVSKMGKTFRKADAIKLAIRNRKYIGEFIFKGKKYFEIIPPVVNKEVFNKANEAINKLGWKVDNSNYYFGNLIECQSGHFLVCKSTKKSTCNYYYYVCETCKNKRINQEKIIKEVLYRLITHSASKDYSKEEKKKILRVKKIDKNVESIYLDYIEGILDTKLYAFTLSKLEAEKSDLLEQMKNLKVSNYIMWDEMSDGGRRKFVHDNVKRIIVDIDLKKVLKIEFK